MCFASEFNFVSTSGRLHILILSNRQRRAGKSLGVGMGGIISGLESNTQQSHPPTATAPVPSTNPKAGFESQTPKPIQAFFPANLQLNKVCFGHFKRLIKLNL